MADDMIDIEEHDVMQNPIIKQIFPDLSVLKKEIIDYNDDEIQEKLNAGTYFERSANLLHNNSSRYSSHKYLNTKASLNNKIILGSKKNTNITPLKRKIKSVLIRDVKIYLQNIRPKLIRSEKFCQTCLTLFSKKQALYNHQILYHNDIDHEKTSLQQIYTKVDIKKKKQNEIYTNDIELQGFKNTAQFVHKTNTTECTLQEKNCEINIMVKINDPSIKGTDTNLIKECFHCSAVFPTRQSLIDHLYEILKNKNSNFKSKKDADKIDFKQTNRFYYSCPICSYYFLTEKYYKGHILSNHNISKYNRIECVKFLSKCKFCHLNYNGVLSYNKHLRNKHRNKTLKKNNYDILKNQHLNKHSKNIVFTCKKRTNLQNKALKKNITISKSSEIHVDTFFKKRIKEVFIMATQAILFKCIDCNVHFVTSEDAQNHSEHSKLLQHWNCTHCQKLFKHVQQNLHEKQHVYSSYFTVVEVNNDAKVLNKCPKCEVEFIEETFSDHQCNFVPEQLKINNRVCDIRSEHDEETTPRKSISDYEIIDMSDISKKFNDIEQNDLDTIADKYKDFYFCDVCKCNITRACNVEEHLRSRCKRFVKYVCEYCGLVLSNNTIISHRRLHQKYTNLNLHDFTFYDLKTKTEILPVSDLPKCESCEKHFIRNYEVVNHFCGQDTYITCPVCKINYSDSAFKLHEPFHSYNLKFRSECKTQQSNDLMSSNIISSSEEITKGDENLLSSSKTECVEFLYLYTCKNCDISMNVYGDVVEHCHSHTHLNKIEVDLVECTLCNVNLISSCFHQHQQLHLMYSKEKFKYFNFDLLYFNVHNDKWLDHVFGTLPKDTINKIIEKSIYKFENKIKLDIIQHGSSELTIYKCDKCKSYVDGKSIYDHIVNCSRNIDKFNCKICNISFICNISRIEHEKNHRDLKIHLKSYRIVTFNREKDAVFNRNVSKTKYYVLFECRYCHVVVDKNTYSNHECNSFTCKSCNICGLLLQEREYDVHILKHKVLDSFNKDNMKVVLIGNKIINKNETRTNRLISTFSGMVCDYTFYKCVKCNVCIKDFRNTTHHYCLIDAAISKCPQCDLSFDEGKIKGHLKLHDTDPDFTKDTIIVKTFGCNLLIKEECTEMINNDHTSNTNDDHENEIMDSDAGVGDRINKVSENICIPEVTAKIYKCDCGLHFINEEQIKEHLNNCSGIVKVKHGRRDCFKCGLTFTSKVLFKHLLDHHVGKNNIFKYEIIENYNNK